MKMLKEFKELISRGNVMDMAIGVVLAGAFGAIVTAVVNNILMPLIGWALAGLDFSQFKIVLKAAEGEAAEVAIGYGLVIQAAISFLVIALFVFMVVKAINRMRRKKEEPAEEEKPAEPDERALLADILEELRKK